MKTSLLASSKARKIFIESSSLLGSSSPFLLVLGRSLQLTLNFLCFSFQEVSSTLVMSVSAPSLDNDLLHSCFNNCLLLSVDVIEHDPDYTGQPPVNQVSSSSKATHKVIKSEKSTASMAESSNNIGDAKQKAQVKILEQPASKSVRFRYECEGRSAGSIPGVNSSPENKTFPAIQVNQVISYLNHPNVV